jgi:hypothetical protein
MMKIKIACFVFAFFMAACVSFAQSGADYPAYWIFFKDKQGVTFDPYTYFHKNTIERRLNAGIPLNDITDFPLNQSYVNAVAAHCDSITIESRWMNAVKIWGSDDSQINKIKSLQFVDRVERAVNGAVVMNATQQSAERTLKDKDLKLAEKQLESMGFSAFKKSGLNGKGVRVAVFDAGFPGLNEHPAFEEHRKENRIAGA